MCATSKNFLNVVPWGPLSTQVLVMAYTPEQKQRWRRRAPERYMMVNIKSKAKKMGLDFNLTEEDFLPYPTVCPVLGIPLIRWTRRGGTDNAPSLDRMDPSKGYIRGNVAIVSKRANRLKQDA